MLISHFDTTTSVSRLTPLTFTFFFFDDFITNMCRTIRQDIMNKTTNENKMPTTRKGNSSILPDQHSEIPEVLGHYWPRVLLPHSSGPAKRGSNKKAEKRVIKALQRRSLLETTNQCYKNDCSYQSVDLAPPLFDLTYSPFADFHLIGEENTPKTHAFSPVTGRPLAITTRKRVSQLIPVKLAKKSRRRRGQPQQSHSTVVASC